jgi:hypothetical protein
LFIIFPKVLSTWDPGDTILHWNYCGEGESGYALEGQNKGWNVGIMEYWNVGIEPSKKPFFQYSTIPIFQ